MMYASWDIECDRHNFCYFGPIFALLAHHWPQKLKFAKNVQKASRYYPFTRVLYIKIIWCLVPEMPGATEFFVILGHFLPFYPTNNPKNQNFEKMKKTTGDIMILHKCIKNHDHKLYYSWDMAHDRCNC